MTSEKSDPVFDSAVLNRLEEIKAMEDFPLPRGAAMAVIRLTQRESTSLAVLAHALKADPIFSVRLIKVANGASGNEHRPVVSLRDAVSVLGVPAVRALAMGFSLLSSHRGGQCGNLDYARFWSHSLARAVALQLLTGATQSTEAEEAFSVGLLARVGELVLAELFPRQYEELLDRRRREPSNRLIDLEQETFGISHNVLTASMMFDFGLPEDYIEAAQLFEDGGEPGPQDAAAQLVTRQLLELADHVADICVAPRAGWRRLMPRLFQLGARLGLDVIVLIAICDRAAHEWREWGSALEVDTGPTPRFENVPAEPEAPRTAANEPAAAASPGDGQGISILVVGDQDRVRMQLCEVLSAAGHTVFEAANGGQGLAMAIELRPQVMLVDLQAGEMDGIELTRSLRQSAVGRCIYILLLTGTHLLTGTDDDEKLVEAFEAGVDDFLTLPIKPRVLAARLRAGQRVVGLQEELARDQDEIRRISAELSATNQQLQEAGMTDMLTGCPNRRYAMDRIQQEWAMATRSQRPLACMIINIDNFKQVNDSHGHDAGDTVLKLVAGALKDEMRAQDVLARTGGDEFLVICPDTTLEAAMACAERIRAVVETLPIVSDAHNARGSVSIGVAVRDAATAEPNALIRLADHSVYLAKRRRNAVATVQSIAPVSARPV